jgi:hypothetical protein
LTIYRSVVLRVTPSVVAFRYGDRWEGKKGGITMTIDEHDIAAELRENVAKAHRRPAEHPGKGDHGKDKERTNAAKQYSQTAHEHTDRAPSMSQQQK